MLRIRWIEHVNNEKVLNKNEKDNYNQKVTVEISGTHEKEGLGEFNTHRTYFKQEGQRETTNYLPNKFM